MSTGRPTTLQEHFPSLEVAVISDVFNECNSDFDASVEHLRALFPEAYVPKTTDQNATDQDPLQEPWTPPTSPVPSPRKLIRSSNTPPRAAAAGELAPDFMQLMFPSPPKATKPQQAEPNGRTLMTRLPKPSASNAKTNDIYMRDMQNGGTDLNGHNISTDQGGQQVPRPVHANASMPFLQNLLPLERPSAKATRSCKSISGDSTDLSPGTPPSVYDVQATASDWDLIMNNSQPPSRRMSGASPSAVPYQNKGKERAAVGRNGLPETMMKLIDTKSPSTRSVSPDKSPASTASQQKPGSEGGQDSEIFLLEMFPTMDADVVRDVLQHVHNDQEKACHQLLVIQNVADCGEGGDPSSSEDGYALASLDGAGSQGEGGSANDGCAWDTSGVPVDYTFKDLTEEQKVAMIRKELPLCSAEEAHNALEACSLDVNFAIASLSQVYDKDGRQLPATGLHANLPQEVFELKKSFPSVDFEALFTALAVSDNNVDVAKAILRQSGLNPVAQPCRIEPRARSPPQKPPSGLFSPPQPADVKQLPMERRVSNGAVQAPNDGRLWRRTHVENQKLYDDKRSLAYFFKAQADKALKAWKRAKDNNDWELAQKHKTEFQQAKINHDAAQNEAAKAIYRAKNSGLNDIPLRLDLHGLHVHEAIAMLEKAIEDWRNSPESMRTAVKRLDVITGKGLHSIDNIARILTAVIEYVDDAGMSYYQKPAKDGVMIHLADTGQPSGYGPGNGYAVVNGYA